jgi:hypothetical protein
MTDTERQILLNQMAILEALIPLAESSVQGTRQLLRLRYGETAKLLRDQAVQQRGT